MATYKVIDQRMIDTAGLKTRCGRLAVYLSDGHSVVADYVANPHRLEISVEGCCIVRVATSWCNAILWGHEFKLGHEAQRVADEVEDYLIRGGCP